MLAYNEVRERAYIVYDDEPYEVLSSHIFRKQQRKPVNQVKLRNLKTGRQIEATFHQADKIEEADIGSREIKYLYTNKDESWFCNPDEPSKRFSLPKEVVDDSLSFMRENDTVTSLVYADEIVGIQLPMKVDLAVTDAPPNVKGNTSSGGSKTVVLETGYSLVVPLFINTGDVVRVNTVTGEYAERVSKA